MWKMSKVSFSKQPNDIKESNYQLILILQVAQVPKTLKWKDDIKIRYGSSN